jgi:hypothetical protein
VDSTPLEAAFANLKSGHFDPASIISMFVFDYSDYLSTKAGLTMIALRKRKVVNPKACGMRGKGSNAGSVAGFAVGRLELV